YEFGAVLGNRDARGAVLEILDHREDRGHDLRLIAAYVEAHSVHRPPGWLDEWLDERLSGEQADAELVLEVTWRAGIPTARSARRILSLLRGVGLPSAAFNCMRFSRWPARLPTPEFLELIGGLAGHRELQDTALFLVGWRLRDHPGEIDVLEATAADLV